MNLLCSGIRNSQNVSLKLPSIDVARRRSWYRSAIISVAGSLLCVGSAVQAQTSQTPQGGEAVQNPPVAPSGDMVMPPPTAKPAPLEKPLKNELGVSADFIYAQGTINLPIGFNFSGLGQKPQVISGNTSTEYFGGTASYSYGRNWYIDLSYEHGISTGTQIISFNQAGGNIKANFDYNDDWYQVYFRYNLSEFLKGSKFKAYLRGGFSLVSATLKAADSSSAKLYQQNDDTTDYLGNIGFGLRYSLYSTLRFKVQLQGEGEGFAGERTQNSTETLPFNGPGALSTTINNTLYGGIGRGTVHCEYLFGETGRLKMFSDVGAFYKYTKVEYSQVNAPSESLWGPYVKVGISYVF